MTAATSGGHAAGSIDHLGLEDVDDFLLGARLLASGGGGGMSAATADWLSHVLADHGTVPVVPADGLAPDSQCAAVGLVGSPTLLEEMLPAGGEPAATVRALERWLGRGIDAVAALDAAGENAVFPAIAAAQLDVPLVDADGMGRVFPLVEQTVFALAGVPPLPLALACGTGGTVIVDDRTDAPEQIIRPIVLAGGGWAMSASYPMTAGLLAHAGIAGSVSRAVGAGRLLRAGAASGDELARRLGGRLLCRGRIVDLEQRSDAGTARDYPAGPGSIVVVESGGLERVVRLEVHNEVLLALADGGIAAAVPDSICLLAAPGRRVVDVEHVTTGMEVEVLVLPAAPAWHTQQGLALAGPAAFGLGIPEWGVPR